ncbi:MULTISPECIES: DegT/DnrJ/EryC1/StrS family aminotransferase [unclassified Sphingomonas]|uniref:DegT/DnrJ/EryC1/StrS family aminotransferase n=1 Tax=unclassified Sphingomonas TaxID=196159 RepID=UPI0006F24924|nr:MULTISPECIES: DegT/DnrJ/EryC1/StrS family aminotransferase [unclassified Sphingomonas]KQX25926.1 DegT/DnrJ/EryC1/StrS aminotransferase [Sphingomonas sp. Root1294]KQY68991.1 DegT/DnrJ/EryC1/StrS aminotransferase [Sphingomonas sp. Root50]KRB89246.1 DegT/DnrJ/EryC1/StrS aminotransferase [Sphingomonas sp. Root720]
MTRIPVARPRMPIAEALLPYLRRIDANRSYTNFGPLVAHLETRLADRLGVDPGCVVTVSNATAGLTLALRSVAEGRSGVCLIPSWTFVATAHAVAAAGFTPFLVDVDEASWAMTPGIALDAVSRIDGPVAAIMPVAPFGAPVDVAAWDRFTAVTGIPVVIDAAAGHDAVGAGETPCVVSLHATKILGAGEGGYVVSRRPERIVAIKQRSNFGFYGTRNAEVAAFNAKMSEYHAAVGLAAMDGYAADIGCFRSLAQIYRDRLAGRADLQPGFGTTWCGSVCVARFVGDGSERIAALLGEAGIDSRAWWGDGVHRQTAFAGLPRLPLPVTEMLARETIGLPYFVDMAEQDVAHVCDMLGGRRRAPLRKAA